MEEVNILKVIIFPELVLKAIDTYTFIYKVWASQVALVNKILLANAEDRRDAGSIPGSGRSPGAEHGSPLQYSYLVNPRDRGAGWAIVHGFVKN